MRACVCTYVSVRVEYVETGETMPPAKAKLATAPMFLCNVASVANLPNSNGRAEDLSAASERMSDTILVESD